MEDVLRVGIIGCGAIAREAHVPAYRGCDQRVELAAVADVDEDRVRSFAAEFSIPRAFTSPADMFEETELDAVSVCVPNKLHASLVIEALEAGCHVLCEKPPAMSAGEAEEMAEAAENAGKFLTYGFHYRHVPEVETLKRFIEGGELGEIYFARAQALRRRGVPGWGVYTSKELQGGGPLIDVGIHMLDTALYLMGYPEPEAVFGSTYRKIGDRKGVGILGPWDWENYSVEDLALGMIRFEGGATVIVETSFAANVGQEEVMQVCLLGDHGGADVFPVKIYQEKHGALTDLEPTSLSVAEPYELEVRRFVDCCLTGVEPLCTAREGVILQKIIDAIYMSAETGAAVDVRPRREVKGE
jgi:predicted dehydrogenase